MATHADDHFTARWVAVAPGDPYTVFESDGPVGDAAMVMVHLSVMIVQSRRVPNKAHETCPKHLLPS